MERRASSTTTQQCNNSSTRGTLPLIERWRLAGHGHPQRDDRVESGHLFDRSIDERASEQTDWHTIMCVFVCGGQPGGFCRVNNLNDGSTKSQPCTANHSQNLTFDRLHISRPLVPPHSTREGKVRSSNQNRRGPAKTIMYIFSTLPPQRSKSVGHAWESGSW